MLIATIILSVLLVCFIAAYCFQLREAKELTRQLKKMNDEDRTQIVTMSFPTDINKNLLGEINRLVLEIQSKEQNCQAMEKQLQELVSNVSHDLRTPLTAILGYVRLINSGGATEEETQKYMKVIEQRALTLQQLIMVFYDISRLNENKYTFEPELTDATGGVCLDVLAELYDELSEGGTAVEVNITHHTQIMVDKQALRRVYENLLQNAKKHGRGNIYISDAIENGELVLSLSNDAEPMCEALVRKVFDRAYSADRQYGNTGFGLSISKMLIEKMGHKIQAYYKDGKFTVQINFTIQGDKNNNE